MQLHANTVTAISLVCKKSSLSRSKVTSLPAQFAIGMVHDDFIVADQTVCDKQPDQKELRNGVSETGGGKCYSLHGSASPVKRVVISIHSPNRCLHNIN